MAYNEELDSRIMGVISNWGTTRKKMFGGTCHLLNGNMMCGVYKDYLILRLGESRAEEALAQPHIKPFDITGRPMKGWVMVSEEAFEGTALDEWLDLARKFAESLPPK
jgi:TfoX/Sxy family transcriptional regulator of competence genes